MPEAFCGMPEVFRTTSKYDILESRRQEVLRGLSVSKLNARMV